MNFLDEKAFKKRSTKIRPLGDTLELISLSKLKLTCLCVKTLPAVSATPCNSPNLIAKLKTNKVESSMEISCFLSKSISFF